MATIKGAITDQKSGQPAACTVHVLSSNGSFIHPDGAVLKVGPGTPAFYCDGSFEVTVPTGGVRVLVERGTEYVPLERNLNVTETQTVDLELPLQRWSHLTEQGWYPGNTHIHYDEKEQQRDDRLELEGHVHDFSVTVVSVLRRWDLDYASNHFPIGVMTDLSTAHHVVDIGEENRHNFHGRRGRRGQEIGYGHVMFLRIRNLVEPVSRGMLIDNLDPDYPPICHACDDARAQDGIVLWCHNGRGLEAPVAAALGKLDGFNLFDPFWMDPEYDIWYRLLNCGIPLPASTGSDWFVCSNNRVYVDTRGQGFDYDRWIDGLKAGRTFITNGPALFLRADGAAPGDTLAVQPDRELEVEVELKSHHRVDRIELVCNGAVVKRWHRPAGAAAETIRERFTPPADGWIAAPLLQPRARQLRSGDLRPHQPDLPASRYREPGREARRRLLHRRHRRGAGPVGQPQAALRQRPTTRGSARAVQARARLLRGSERDRWVTRNRAGAWPDTIA